MYGWFERAKAVWADTVGTEASQLQSQAVRTFAAAFNLDRDAVMARVGNVVRFDDGGAHAVVEILVGQPAWLSVAVYITFVSDQYTGTLRLISREEIVVGDATFEATDNPYENFATAGREIARLLALREPHTVSA